MEQLELPLIPTFTKEQIYMLIHGVKLGEDNYGLSIPQVNRWGIEQGLKEFIIEYPSVTVYRLRSGGGYRRFTKRKDFYDARAKRKDFFDARD